MAEEKLASHIVFVGKVAGKRRLLVDFDGGSRDRFRTLQEMVGGARTHGGKLEVLADLRTGEFEGLHWTAPGGRLVDQFEPADQRSSGSQRYVVEGPYSLRRAVLPAWMVTAYKDLAEVVAPA